MDKQNNQSEVKQNDTVTFLKEMHESMKASIDNLSVIIGQQVLLISILEKSEHKETFKDFVATLKEGKENYEGQYKELNNRAMALSYIIDKIDDDNEDNLDIVETLMTALGVKTK